MGPTSPTSTEAPDNGNGSMLQFVYLEIHQLHILFSQYSTFAACLVRIVIVLALV